MAEPPRNRTWIVPAVPVLVALVTMAALAVAAEPSPAPVRADTTAGCGRAPTLTSGTHMIQSGGTDRSFILDLPDNYDPDHAYRLIFGFHWLGGTAVDVATGRIIETGTWSYYGLQRLAGDTAIFVAPQGLNNGWSNTGGADIAFVDDMRKLIEADLCVDTAQRFSLGFSFGGAMSYSLACSRAGVFRAIAVYGSPGLISGCSGGTDPIAIFAAHGTNDQFSDGISQRDRFAANNGCAPQTTPEPAPGSRTHVTTVFSGCSEDHPVVWASFDGEHNPAPRDGAPGGGPDTWLPGETWEFFRQF